MDYWCTCEHTESDFAGLEALVNLQNQVCCLMLFVLLMFPSPLFHLFFCILTGGGTGKNLN